MKERTEPRLLPTRDRALLLGACLLGALACVTAGRKPSTPREGWWEGHGPVVPHDTFPADCSLCHAGDDWRTIREDFSFDHGDETGVALVGAHAGAECLRCHNDKGPVAVFAGRGCRGCHEDVHRGELGQDCESCHDEADADWRLNEVIATHNRTRFPLVGAHAAAPCWRCHPGAQVGNFLRTATECVSCHRADLARAKNPDHVARGWVQGCDRCHIPTTWAGAGFSHAIWPLTGAHRTVDCTACHAGGVFTGTPNQCVDCHLSEYLGTTDPDHPAAGFPMQCEICHGTFSWQGATFDHSFPIESGPHRRDCSECHLIPGSFLTFSCTHCHEHRESAMADKHSGVSGYVWQSSSCLACHPDGRE